MNFTPYTITLLIQQNLIRYGKGIYVHETGPRIRYCDEYTLIVPTLHGTTVH